MTSASTTQLVVTVPSGATTGVVKVTVGRVTVSSTQSLSIVPAGAAPTIASFSPTEGAPGASVSITGTNFATTSADDKVLFNDAPALVTAATATKLTVTVPVDAAPGPIQVITPTGSATSASDFIAPPSGYTTSSIGSSGTIVEGGAAVAVSLSAGKIALELFTGTSGDWLTLGVSGLTASSATLIVYSPLIPIALQANQNYELTISEQPGNFPALQATVIDGFGGTTLVATCSSTCQLGAVAQYTGTSPSDSVSASAAGPYTLLIQQLTQISGPNAYRPLAGDFELQLTSDNP